MRSRFWRRLAQFAISRSQRASAFNCGGSTSGAAISFSTLLRICAGQSGCDAVTGGRSNVDAGIKIGSHTLQLHCIPCSDTKLESRDAKRKIHCIVAVRHDA